MRSTEISNSRSIRVGQRNILRISTEDLIENLSFFLPFLDHLAKTLRFCIGIKNIRRFPSICMLTTKDLGHCGGTSRIRYFLAIYEPYHTAKNLQIN